jgi:hypothetical protein
MSFNIPPILAYIGSWFLTMGGVWALFERAERVMTTDMKKRIPDWILTAQISPKNTWPVTFEIVSDNLFGRKLFSLRSFKEGRLWIEG